MPTRKQITGAIDASLTSYIPQIAAAQENYKNSHGRYAQGLSTHSTLPADGNRRAADKLDDKPHYQQESWNDLKQQYGFTFPASPRVAARIDQYKRPDDTVGWVVYFTLKVGNEIWVRAVNGAGGETQLTQDWTLVTPPPNLVIPQAVQAQEVAPQALTQRDETQGRGIDWKFVLTRAAVGSAIAAGAIGAALAAAELFLK